MISDRLSALFSAMRERSAARRLQHLQFDEALIETLNLDGLEGVSLLMRELLVRAGFATRSGSGVHTRWALTEPGREFLRDAESRTVATRRNFDHGSDPSST